MGSRALAARPVGCSVSLEGLIVVATVIKHLAKREAEPRLVCPRRTGVRERLFQRLLHNETAYQLQRRLQFAGLNTMVLPVRVMSEKKA